MQLSAARAPLAFLAVLVTMVGASATCVAADSVDQSLDSLERAQNDYYKGLRERKVRSRAEADKVRAATLAPAYRDLNQTVSKEVKKTLDHYNVELVKTAPVSKNPAMKALRAKAAKAGRPVVPEAREPSSQSIEGANGKRGAASGAPAKGEIPSSQPLDGSQFPKELSFPGGKSKKKAKFKDPEHLDTSKPQLQGGDPR